MPAPVLLIAVPARPVPPMVLAYVTLPLVTPILAVTVLSHLSGTFE
jgi:hypothetical protein